MVFSLWLWPNTDSTSTKNTRQTLAISMAMRIPRLNAGCISQWSTSVASCKATRCRHRASAHAVLPRRPPWSTISKKNTHTNKTQLLPTFRTVDRQKKLNNFETRQEPSTHALGATFSDPNNPYATIPVEGISYILSYQTWKTDKNSKVMKLKRSPRKPVGHIWPYSG